MTLELVDISAGGGAFRAGSTAPGLGQRVAFGFVIPDRGICVARGQVVRIDRQGFALMLDRSNRSFREFLGDVSGRIVCAA